MANEKRIHTPEREIRVVLNQCGATLELHRAGKIPVVLTMFRPEQISAYGHKVARDNPDMLHATIGQTVLAMAREIAKHDCPVNPHVWEYNASTAEYSHAN